MAEFKAAPDKLGELATVSVIERWDCDPDFPTATLEDGEEIWTVEYVPELDLTVVFAELASAGPSRDYYTSE